MQKNLACQRTFEVSKKKASCFFFVHCVVRMAALYRQPAPGERPELYILQAAN